MKAFVNSFNEVFDIDLSESYFQQKYLQTPKGYSYHTYMIADNKVVGSCNVVPYQYLVGREMKTFGLMTDIFIHSSYRGNPLSMMKMISAIKEQLKKEDIPFLMAVPNSNSYPYLKKIVKWKDIGQLSYFALPVRIGNVLKKTAFLNGISKIYTMLHLQVAALMSFFLNKEQASKNIRINQQNPLFDIHRYYDYHKKVKLKNGQFFSYRMVNENGVNTAYIIDFFNKNLKKDSMTLNKACRYICKNERPDLILYVGDLSFFQLNLIKIPRSKEPKPLHFAGEILLPNEINTKIFDFKEWDFGLLNYDVR